MILMRRFSAALAGALFLAAFAASSAGAQDQPAPETPEAPKPPAAPEPEKESGKPPWWGGRNLLYLEVNYGQSSIDTIETSILTEVDGQSHNLYEIDSTKAGRVAVGWTLPDGRGQFLFAYEGFREDGFKFDAVGSQAKTQGGNSSAAPFVPIPWWLLSIRDGNLASTRMPPVWDEALDDADGDGHAGPSEVRYPTTDFQGSALVTRNLGNEFRTMDLLYGREFGGRRIWGSWSAGGRYFTYSGAVPAAAWLVPSDASAGQGFTDGGVIRLLSFQQDSKGFGPTGSLGINFGFFRRKLVLYAGARLAYLLSSLETDSGDFDSFVPASGGGLDPAPAHLSESADKSVWHLQAEASGVFQIAPGFDLRLVYRRTGYQDAMIFPYALSVPDNVTQIPQGSVAVFGTRDLRVQTLTLGMSYQF